MILIQTAEHPERNPVRAAKFNAIYSEITVGQVCDSRNTFKKARILSKNTFGKVFQGMIGKLAYFSA